MTTGSGNTKTSKNADGDIPSTFTGICTITVRTGDTTPLVAMEELVSWDHLQCDESDDDDDDDEWPRPPSSGSDIDIDIDTSECPTSPSLTDSEDEDVYTEFSCLSPEIKEEDEDEDEDEEEDEEEEDEKEEAFRVSKDILCYLLDRAPWPNHSTMVREGEKQRIKRKDAEARLAVLQEIFVRQLQKKKALKAKLAKSVRDCEFWLAMMFKLEEKNKELREKNNGLREKVNDAKECVTMQAACCKRSIETARTDLVKQVAELEAACTSFMAQSKELQKRYDSVCKEREGAKTLQDDMILRIHVFQTDFRESETQRVKQSLLLEKQGDKLARTKQKLALARSLNEALEQKLAKGSALETSTVIPILEAKVYETFVHTTNRSIRKELEEMMNRLSDGGKIIGSVNAIARMLAASNAIRNHSLIQCYSK